MSKTELDTPVFGRNPLAQAYPYTLHSPITNRTFPLFHSITTTPLALFKGSSTHQNFCLPNSLRVEKYLFTRKEIFTYTLKRNYL
ncbi:MAG: hypothetical protein ACTTI1_08920, partial [Prevotella intermedia]